MQDTPLISILMATYNGGHYIRQQLDSLLAQTYTNWELLIRDDGSNDETIRIIGDYISRNNNISLIVNDTGDKGACLNFSVLFSLAKNNKQVKYIMFCDQDDVWKREKVERSVKAIQALENEFKQQPALTYSNFELMDSNGNFVAGEFNLKHKLDLRNLISFNYVYGCTVIMNRPMMDKINYIPREAINHDYWVALVASIYNSKYIDDQLLQYRQHTFNVSGNFAGNNGMLARLKRNVLLPGKEIEGLQARIQMLSLFHSTYHTALTAPNSRILVAYLNALKAGRLAVIFVMLRYRIFRRGFFQTFASFFQVLFFYKKIQSKN